MSNDAKHLLLPLRPPAMALELLAEIDIFEDPHKGDTDYYQPSDDGRDEGGDGARNMVDHCGEPLTDTDRANFSAPL